MHLLQAALPGVGQGLTEYLPTSTSAHPILARAFVGRDGSVFGLAFDVACHLGTLLAVVVYFWRDLLAMAGSPLHPFDETQTARMLQRVHHRLSTRLPGTASFRLVP